ncbi:oxaloacetate decarboxylase subunit beta [Streptococcus equi subsp. zooepidemicus Sz35]|nr:sodium ion-translocating decarboxylase subunit beta [Streptococcus equi]KIS14512.1 oxaloacetate decarboxylase subunit beta [Streptococcus equi subsp. zooepidemicus SzAM60]KIS20260.1 oxaloacetate decarboxylase subunit beta [Streptococcus equi subsp. zooepidemicus Sz35]SUN53359.1 methylmalonyl-CoA decarboxylase beta chain [Streptococcus equi subsp. zooepidemicus]
MIPNATTLIGCLMLGNLVRKINIVPKLVENLQQLVMFCITIVLSLTVGAKANGDLFLSIATLKIIALGLMPFWQLLLAGS